MSGVTRRRAEPKRTTQSLRQACCARPCHAFRRIRTPRKTRKEAQLEPSCDRVEPGYPAHQEWCRACGRSGGCAAGGPRGARRHLDGLVRPVEGDAGAGTARAAPGQEEGRVGKEWVRKVRFW